MIVSTAQYLLSIKKLENVYKGCFITGADVVTSYKSENNYYMTCIISSINKYNLAMIKANDYVTIKHK